MRVETFLIVCVFYEYKQEKGSWFTRTLFFVRYNSDQLLKNPLLLRIISIVSLWVAPQRITGPVL